MATKRKAVIQDTEILAIFIDSSTQSDQFVCHSESSDSEFFVTTSLKEAKKEMLFPDNASKIATKVMISFKDFITIIITYMPDLITRNEVLFLMKNFFDALTLECQDFTNPVAIIAMSEICFELIKKWGSDSFEFEERKAACEKICHLLISSAEFYRRASTWQFVNQAKTSITP
ncbi:unnamed protein product [Timema podura]|uniref:Uncharacterized protein n=1 Tax=Timema podura TaxID=61482 RepID=A0ABN7NR85_TIMPD|nr:unnamed protein product [Timema podura]